MPAAVSQPAGIDGRFVRLVVVVTVVDSRLSVSRLCAARYGGIKIGNAGITKRRQPSPRGAYKRERISRLIYGSQLPDRQNP